MRNRALAGLLAALIVLATCSAQGGVTVTLDEYVLKPELSREEAGVVTFTARNIGSIAHQLIVLQTERAADDLPTRKGVVQLDAKRIEVAGEIDIVADGDSEVLSLTMDPGPYVLICNIASHYENGMRAAFEVGP